MTVTIIRKQSGQANEVTDAMVDVVRRTSDNSQYSTEHYLKFYKAMEAARIAENGKIERIEVGQEYIGLHNKTEKLVVSPEIQFIRLEQKDYTILVTCNNILPLAEALLELGKQMKGVV